MNTYNEQDIQKTAATLPKLEALVGTMKLHEIYFEVVNGEVNIYVKNISSDKPRKAKLQYTRRKVGSEERKEYKDDSDTESEDGNSKAESEEDGEDSEAGSGDGKDSEAESEDIKESILFIFRGVVEVTSHLGNI